MVAVGCGWDERSKLEPKGDGGLLRAPPKADAESPLGRRRQSREAARAHLIFFLPIVPAAEGGRRSPPY